MRFDKLSRILMQQTSLLLIVTACSKGSSKKEAFDVPPKPDVTTGADDKTFDEKQKKSDETLKESLASKTTSSEIATYAKFSSEMYILDQELGSYVRKVRGLAAPLVINPPNALEKVNLESIHAARVSALKVIDSIEDTFKKSIVITQRNGKSKLVWIGGPKNGKDLTDEEIKTVDLSGLKSLIIDHNSKLLDNIRAVYKEKGVAIPEALLAVRSGSIAEVDDATGESIPLTEEEIKSRRESTVYDVDAFDNFRALAATSGAPFFVAKSPENLPQVVNSISEHIENGAVKLRPLEVVLVIDSTGSMADDISSVKDNMATVIKNFKKMQDDGFTVRVGLEVYRDDSSDSAFVTKKVFDLSADLVAVDSAIQQIVTDGGGDTAEAVLDALRDVQSGMSWDSNAQRKIVLIGDAPGHPNTKVAPFQTTDEIMESLKKDGVEVVVYPVIVPK